MALCVINDILWKISSVVLRTLRPHTSLVTLLRLDSFSEGYTSFTQLTFIVVRIHYFTVESGIRLVVNLLASNRRHINVTTATQISIMTLVTRLLINHRSWCIRSITFEKLLVINTLRSVI